MADLQLSELEKRFGGARAVDRVSLAVQEGEFFALLGPSGCGKTTTLRIVAGLVQPDAGRVILAGRDITREPPRARDLSMVFQSYALFPHLTVFENVAFGLEMRHVPVAERARRVAEALDLVQLAGSEGRYPRQLSGGQQQRVALARAVVVQPQVLLFDEPLSNLDAKLRERMRDEIRALQQRLGITAVYVTHDQAEALAVADRIAVMNEGRVQQVGSPVDIYERPANQFVADFIGQTNLLRGRVRRLAGGEAVLETEHGLRLAVPEAILGDAERVVLAAVRPERVRLSPLDGADDAGQNQGRVTESTYLGSLLHVRVATEHGTLLASMPNTGGWTPRPGDAVRITVRAEDCVVFHD